MRWIQCLILGIALVVGPCQSSEVSLASLLEGSSFPGRIKAEGLLGLFSVQGVLSFENGHLLWTAGDTRDMAPYVLERSGPLLHFQALLVSADGTSVNWTGVFDGTHLTEVTAIWDREHEKDFIHDLLLPDVVTLHFRQDPVP